jgi:hypothetical protein
VTDGPVQHPHDDAAAGGQGDPVVAPVDGAVAEPAVEAAGSPDPDAFPFPADHDPAAERAARGPFPRRDAIASAVLLVAGGLIAGGAAAVGVLMILVAADPGALLAFAGPAVVVVAAVVAVILRVRSRRRAWPFAAAALGLALVLAAVGAIWWAADAHLV